MVITCFVALFFVRNEEGQPVSGEAQRRPSVGNSESAARRPAMVAADAAAFSRTGDPYSGEFKDALVIESFGKVPSLLSAGG